MPRVRFDPTVNAGAVLQLLGLLLVIGLPALVFYGDLRTAVTKVGELQGSVDRLATAIQPVPLLSQRIDRAERRLDDGEVRDARQDQILGEHGVAIARTQERMNLLRPPVTVRP